MVIITRTLCIQLEKARKRPQKYYTKIIVSGNYFVMISARMVDVASDDPPDEALSCRRRLGTFPIGREKNGENVHSAVLQGGCSD